MSDRKTLLTAAGQDFLTGIDFIRVLDRNQQDRIAVFFLVPPEGLSPPLVDPASVASVGDTTPATLDLHLEAEPGIRIPPISEQIWHHIDDLSGRRVVLEIGFEHPGDFTDYRLSISHDQIDPYFAADLFSFQQACPDPFDCAPEPCPDLSQSDPELDYLARDFASFNRALSDYAARNWPDWREDIPADIAVMLKELLAYAGDELAYLQDRLSLETRFGSATQRRSLAGLASLVDYRPNPGRAATGEIVIEVTEGLGGVVAKAASTVWAVVSGGEPVPFRLSRDVWLHETWNALALHVLDPDQPCLVQGATSACLATTLPLASDIDPASPLTPAQYLIGRRMALSWTPPGDARQSQAAIVTITAVTEHTDRLQLSNGQPTPYLRVHWDTPLPFTAPQSEITASLNIAPVVAGQQVVELFRVGNNGRFAEANPALNPAQLAPLLALPRVVERDGPLEGDGMTREPIMRYGLRASEAAGLGWNNPESPRLMLEVLDPATGMVDPATGRLDPTSFAADPASPAFVYFADLVAADDDDRAFTLEPGAWRDVVHHQRPTDVLIFEDYAGDAGWSVRFGAGAYGQPPAIGMLFRVTYDTGPGSAANLPSGSITHLQDPVGHRANGLTIASRVYNPLAITGGQDEESADHLRLHAPVAYQSSPRRAVRPEDYATILGKLAFIQRANAVTRHTGSWSTDFVAADPLSGTTLADAQAVLLANEIACIRQAGRDARPIAAEYLDLDLEVTICIAPDHPAADVIEAVTAALAPPGLFDPDNFTFGQPLFRSAVEAAVQAVAGVRFVSTIRYRLRGQQDWQPFTAAAIETDRNRIIRLMHDPLFPARGTLRIRQREAVS